MSRASHASYSGGTGGRFQNALRAGLLILLCGALVACGGGNIRAPVGERGERPVWNPGFHTVKRGESLYSIAWQYGYDYQTLAKWNGIKTPYTIYAGQKLRVKPPSQTRASSSANTSQSRSSSTAARSPTRQVPRTASSSTRSSEPAALSRDGSVTWRWPANGPVIRRYNHKGDGKKGIAIGGVSGSAVRAAAAGKVVYAGSGLVGYGRLIIVKHNKSFLSAYGHNQNLAVKEGDWVKRGQQIASMGNSGTSRTMLHFEIRRYGKPVDPLRYLPRR